MNGRTSQTQVTEALGGRNTGRLHDVKQQQTKLDLGLSLDGKAVKDTVHLVLLPNVLRTRNNDD